jgi:soluble lytic murein transglycosylase-like protein
MRRSVLIAATLFLLAAVAAGALWWAKRTVRWNDARTMPPPLEAAVRAYAKGDDATGLGQVRRLLSRYRAPAWEPRARVLAATRLARAGRAAEIPELLPKDLPDANPLSAHASLLRARGFLARGRADKAAESAARAVSAPGFPASIDAAIVRAQALDLGGAWREGISRLAAESGCDAVLAAARIAAAHGDRETARRRLVAAIREPRTRADDLERLLPALEQLVPDAAVRFEAAERADLPRRAASLVEDNRAETALALLRAARAGVDPAGAPPAEALAEAGALVKLGRAREASSALSRARAGDAATRDGAGYLEARIASGEGRYAAYRSRLEALARAGVPPWRLSALLDLARIVDGVPSAEALDAYRRYRLAAGESADPLALLREGFIAFELGRKREADAGFARCLARADAPDGVRAAALYWSARRLDADGHAAGARDIDRRLAEELPNHYYGILAARRGGLPPPTAPADLPRLGDPGGPGAAGRWIEAARAFVSVGLWDEAAPCYRSAVAGAGRDAVRVALEAARAAQDTGAVAEAIGFAQAAIGDRIRTPAAAVPRPLWRLLAPAPVGEAITRQARAHRLDPNLVAAVALQESAWNPLAVSSAGARGLLQVMPDVGAELARAAGLKTYKPADLDDPEINLRLGCAHLRDYVDRLGSVPRALAAYNGGPARVMRWTLPRDDDERFVERIPIPETRIYVKRVLQNQRLYAIAWPDGLGSGPVIGSGDARGGNPR